MNDTKEKPKRVFAPHLNSDRGGQQLDSKELNFRIRLFQMRHVEAHGKPFKGVLTSNEIPGLEWDVFITNSGTGYSIYRSPNSDEFYKLGQGAFGKVYLAQSIDDGEWVAIKEQNPNNPAELEEIIHENEMLDRVGEYVDGLENNSFMKLAKGQSLRNFIGKMPLPEMLGMMHALSHEMDSVNNNLHVVHRDLKPDNIMYDPVTKKVKVIDFGLATKHETGQPVIGSYACGTILYMGPEIPKSNRFSHSSDIYAMGLTMAEFLTKGPGVATNKISPGLAFFESLKSIHEGVHPQLEDAFSDVLGENRPKDLSPEMNAVYDLVAQMLDADYTKRPTWDVIQNTLNKAYQQELKSPQQETVSQPTSNKMIDELTPYMSDKMTLEQISKALENSPVGTMLIVKTDEPTICTMYVKSPDGVDSSLMNIEEDRVITELSSHGSVSDDLSDSFDGFEASSTSVTKKMLVAKSASDLISSAATQADVTYIQKVSNSMEPEFHQIKMKEFWGIKEDPLEIKPMTASQMRALDAQSTSHSSSDFDDFEVMDEMDVWAGSVVINETNDILREAVDLEASTGSVVINESVALNELPAAAVEEFDGSDTVEFIPIGMIRCHENEQDKLLNLSQKELSTLHESLNEMLNSLEALQEKVDTPRKRQLSLTMSFSADAQTSRDERSKVIAKTIDSIKETLAKENLTSKDLLELSYNAVDLLMEEFNITRSKPKASDDQLVEVLLDISNTVNQTLEQKKILGPTKPEQNQDHKPA